MFEFALTWQVTRAMVCSAADRTNYILAHAARTPLSRRRRMQREGQVGIKTVTTRQGAWERSKTPLPAAEGPYEVCQRVV